MSSNQSKISLELQKLVALKSGRIIVDFVSPITPITVECVQGHQFSEFYRNLKTGSWCQECVDDSSFFSLERVEQILLEEGFDPKRSPVIPGNSTVRFDIGLYNENTLIVIDIDKETVFKDPIIQEKVINKVDLSLKTASIKIIRIDLEMLNDLDKLNHFMWSAITGRSRLCLSNPQNYLWLRNKTTYEESKEQIVTNPKILGPNSEITEGDAGPLPDIERGQFGVVGYIRVSTIDQALWGVSLSSQAEKIKQFAVAKGFTLAKIYADKGLSGRELKSRPALIRLLEDLKPRYYVTVLSLSRLARNNREASDVLFKVQEKKAYMMALDLDLDTRTPTGALMFNLLNSLSQFESDQIAERVTMNMQHLARQNKLRSRPPFGYDFVDKNSPYVTNPKEQEIIAFIAKLKRDDPQITCSQVASRLNNENLTTKKGCQFYHNTVKKIMIDNNIIDPEPIEHKILPRSLRGTLPNKQ
jgi:DNA invertase Pin-like site-specific DNA recombinase